jgi:hypothetical protein
VRFHAYLDGGTAAAPSNVMTAVLKSSDGSVLEQWDGNALSHLPTLQPAQDITIGARLNKTQFQYTLNDADPGELQHWSIERPLRVCQTVSYSAWTCSKVGRAGRSMLIRRGPSLARTSSARDLPDL